MNKDRKKKHTIRVRELLLCASIIVSPLRCYGFVIGGFNFSLFRVFGLAMILSCLTNKYIRYSYLSMLMFFLVSISICQAGYSSSISGAHSNFYSIVFGYAWIGFALAIIGNNTSLKRSVHKFIPISSLFPLMLGLYQWITYKNTGHVPALPFSFLVSTEGKTGMTYNVYARITSCFGDPAYFATFLVGLFCYSLERLLGNNPYETRRSLTTFYTLSILCILSIIEILMAISLSGILGLLSAIAFAVIFNIGTLRRRFNLRMILLPVILGGLTYVYLWITNFELVNILFFKANTSSQGANNLFGRIGYINNALNVIFEHPLIGGGFGGLRLSESGFSSAHSSLLTVAGQQGIPVLLLHLYLLIYRPLVRMRTLTEEGDIQYARVTVSSLLTLIILSLGYDTLYSMDFCYVFIALAMASEYTINTNQYI